MRNEGGMVVLNDTGWSCWFSSTHD